MALSASFLYSYKLHKKINYLEESLLAQRIQYNTDKICNQIEQNIKEIENIRI